MSQDDPFAEPGDTERTVIRPIQQPQRPAAPQMPPQQPYPPQPGPGPIGGAPQYTAPAQQPNVAPQATAAGASVGIDAALSGLNKLTTAAAPLFALVGRIRNRAQHANPEALRQAVIREIKAFEQRALEQQIEVQQLRIARYLICATIDDVVLNTPWGGQSVWTQQSMVITFHKEARGGNRVFDLLERMEKEPARHRDLLEFLYVCLSLGFEGQLRAGIDAGGPEKHFQLRDNLARLLRTQRGEIERGLSPNWKGVAVPHRPLSAWAPIWMISGVVGVLLVGIFFAYSWLLSGGTERVQGQLAALIQRGPVSFARPAVEPPPPPPPPPEIVEVSEIAQISGFLQPEVDAGRVEVFEKGNTVTVRIPGEGMFASASDTLQPEFVKLIKRIGEELTKTKDDPRQATTPEVLPPVLIYPGDILVVGHSDNIPIRTSRFPNNTALSLKRAESVMKLLAKQNVAPERLSAEGRADREPIADNKNSEGRAKNRRIELVIVKSS